MAPLLELLEKAEIAGVEMPYIIHPVPENCYAFDSHAEGKAGIHSRIDAAAFEHIGMDHPCPQYFEPSRVATKAATSPPALDAFDGDLTPGFDKRKVVTPEPCTRLPTEDALTELEQGLFEIA